MLNFDKTWKKEETFNTEVLSDAQLQSISILYFFPKSMTLFSVPGYEINFFSETTWFLNLSKW